MDSAVLKESMNGHRMRSFAVLTPFTKLTVAAYASLTPLAKDSGSGKAVTTNVPSTIEETRQRKRKLLVMHRARCAT